MMRFAFPPLLLALLALLALPVQPASAEKLRLGILPVLDTLPLQVAVRDGYFEKEGLEVELVSFTSALERDTAMQSGSLDGYFGDILNTLLLIDNGVPMRMVTVSWRTTPGQPMFALLRGNETQENPASLEVGISTSTIIEYLLDRMRTLSAVAGTSIQAVEVKQIPIRVQMLLSGQLQGALLPEPLASLADSEGAHVMATDEELDMPLTVVCLHERYEDLTEDFIDAYAAAVRSINGAPETFRELMVETTRVPKPLARSFPVYTFPEPKLPGEQDVWAVQQWMLTRGLLKGMLDYKELVP